MEKYITLSCFKAPRFRIKLCALIILFIPELTSCKKLVQIGAPKTQLAATSVFNDNSSATAAQTVIYSQMENRDFMPYLIPLIAGLSSDELSNYSTFQDQNEIYRNAINPTDNGMIQNIWAAIYNYIYEANAVILGLRNSERVSAPVKQQLTGEAEFIRAYWYFYLVNLFGDVPLITTTNYSINAVAARAGKAQVYQQIVADLKNAQNLLNSDYVDASDTTVTTERVRPTKWAATALLARVYLYIGDYANAEVQSTAVINTAMYSLVSNLNEVFLKNSPEAIWQLMPVGNSSINSYEGYYFILTSTPLTNVFNSTTLSDQLLGAFEKGDNRRVNWVDSITVSGQTYFFPYKYKVQSSSSITEYSTVLRLAEQYLIRAEARVQQNKLAEADADLNIIRNRAGLSDYAGTIDKTSLLAAILHERQVELFTEWGHRWMDLKRTGKIDPIMNIVTPQKGGAWNSNRQLYPIPQSERVNDPNLTQNPGY